MHQQLQALLRGEHVAVGDVELAGWPREIDRHRLLPLLAERMAQGRVTGVPEPAARRIADGARYLAARQLAVEATARRAIDALAAAGIETLLLKGAALAYLVYPRPHHRTAMDVDLFVPPESSEPAKAALAGAGFGIWQARNRPVSIGQFGARLDTGGITAWIDAHRRISNRTLLQGVLRFDESILFKQPVPALGANAFALSNVDLLLHALFHRVAHGRGSNSERLIWLYDIHLLVRRMSPTELDQFAEKAIERDIAGIALDGLRRADAALETRPPGRIMDALESAGPEPSAELIDANRWQVLWSDISGLPTLSKKLKLLIEIAGNATLGQRARPQAE